MLPEPLKTTKNTTARNIKMKMLGSGGPSNRKLQTQQFPQTLQNTTSIGSNDDYGDNTTMKNLNNLRNSSQESNENLKSNQFVNPFCNLKFGLA